MIGWRVYGVDRHGHLKSAWSQDVATIWAGASEQAWCRYQRHDPPDDGCVCGIYFWPETTGPAEAFKYLAAIKAARAAGRGGWDPDTIDLAIARVVSIGSLRRDPAKEGNEGALRAAAVHVTEVYVDRNVLRLCSNGRLEVPAGVKVNPGVG